MACTNAKSMRFRVYECRYPGYARTSDAPPHLYHDPQFHFDTGKEFTITVGEDTPTISEELSAYYGSTHKDHGITDETITLVMFKKIYGFTGSRFGPGFRITSWTDGKKFMNGTIYGIWYIKRVL